MKPDTVVLVLLGGAVLIGGAWFVNSKLGEARQSTDRLAASIERANATAEGIRQDVAPAARFVESVESLIRRFTGS